MAIKPYVLCGINNNYVFFLYTLFNKCKMTFESLTDSRNMQSEHQPEDGIRDCE